MSKAATQAALLEGNGNFHQTLLQIKPQELLSGTWTQAAAPNDDCWYLAVTQYPDRHNVRRVVEATVVDWQETALTSLAIQLTLALCQATPNSFFFDTALSRIYVNWNTGVDPTSNWVTVGFWLYFSMGGENGPATYAGVSPDTDTQDYRPFLLEVPIVTRELPADTSGLPVVGSGNIRLASAQVNPRYDGAMAPGGLDPSVTRYFWEGAEARVLFCGDLVPASEFLEMWRGRVKDHDWVPGELTLTCEDENSVLSQTIQNPLSIALDFTENTYARTSTPLPICIGECHDVLATLVEESTLLFACPGHRCASIEAVKVGGVEVIPLNVERNTTSPAGCGLWIHLGEQHRAAVVEQKAAVTVDLVGLQYPVSHAMAYRPITNAVWAAYYLLTQYAGVSAAQLNAGSTWDGTARRVSSVHVTLTVSQATPATEILTILFSSARIAAYPNAGSVELNLIYNALPRSDDTASVTLDDRMGDVQGIRVYGHRTGVYYRNDVSAALSSMDAASGANAGTAPKVAQALSLLAQLSTGVQDSFQLSSTAIENERQAAYTAQLYRVWSQFPASLVEVETTKRAFTATPLAAVRLTTQIAPDETAWSERLMRVKSIALTLGVQEPTARLILLDMEQYLVRPYAQWRSSAYLTWATAGASDKEFSGFWTDDNGYCDPADPTSLLQSLWG